MPLHEEHCQDSLRRYGKRFDELHRWMDEPSDILGPKHRKYRHDPNKTPHEARQLFGEFADQACLDHIRLDRLTSRGKALSITRESQVPQQIGLVFALALCLLMGFVLTMTVYTWIFAIVFFFFAFLCFLALIGSSLENVKKPQNKEAIYANKIQFGNDRTRIDLESVVVCPYCKCHYYKSEYEKCPKCEV